MSAMQPDALEKPPSLWRELADGSAGPVVRAAVSVALAPLLAGAAFIGSYVLAEWMPPWSVRWGGRVRPTDELVGAMIALASVAFLLGLTWIWTRGRHTLHEFWKAGLFTAAVVVLTTALCVFVADSPMWRGAEEVLVGGLVCLGLAAVILIWVQAGRRHVRRRPSHNAADGLLDVRCPSCGYRMVGLRESRCPECGTSYTLDELIGRQPFMGRGHPVGVAPPTDGNGVPERHAG
jgi:hypothetical protein